MRRRADRFDAALKRLDAASALLRPQAQQEVQTAAAALLESAAGLETLAERAPRFDAAGLFEGTPWEDPLRLQPRLVAGGLLGDPPYPTMEALNLLRMLGVATGKASGDGIEPREAVVFLERVIALNLDFLFPRETEATRDRNRRREEAAGRLFTLLLDRLPGADFLDLVIQEIDEICAQRRIWTGPVRKMIRLASRLPGAPEHDDERLHRFVEAILGPSPMSRRFRAARDYRGAITEVDDDVLDEECRSMAESLRGTGLACPQHAVLLRHVARNDPGRLGEALGLDATGRQELGRHTERVTDLVAAAIHPGTAQTAYGLARLLERGLLSEDPAAKGLLALAELPLHADVERRLLATREADDALSANAILLSGAIRTLGQPLGIGQGRNPTCQAARGISLWAQHRPDYLLDILHSAARDDDVHVYFGDGELHSKDLTGGVAWRIDPALDPLSLVLVPHLDRLYDEMMRRVAHLGGDGHRWVNPGLYGRTVPSGFATCFDTATWQVREHPAFLRRFYATHHPALRRAPLRYPNPVGILVTTVHADLLGLHAVTIQRVDADPDGEVRVYFYNPNDEGRQDWGQGIRPSIRGHGEREGECSLPFEAFASRLYAFHYDPFQEGDAFAAPDDALERIGRLARESWGTSYVWAA